VREVREETGIEVAIVRYAGKVERDSPLGAVYDIDDFVCRPVGGELRAGDDAADARWVSLDQLRALPLAPGLEAALSEWGALPS